MINATGATSRIETVMVTIGNEIIDCTSFTTTSDAGAYKRGVRNWAIDRGVTLQVISQVMDIEEKSQARRLMRLALAS